MVVLVVLLLHVLPVFLARLSPKIAEIQVNHRERGEGKSKYPFFKSCEIIFSFLASYSFKAFRILGILGLVSTALGIGLVLLYILLFYISGLQIPRVGLVLSVVVIVGVQFFIIGILGDLVHRIYRITNNQPLFVVEKTLSGEGGS